MENTEWKKEFEIEKSSFLIFDKASGSRFLNEEKVIAFIESLLASRKEKMTEEIKEKLLIASANPETAYEHIDAEGKRRRCVLTDEIINILSPTK